jgi:hypothetical protein
VITEIARSRDAIDSFLQTDVAMVINSVDAVETFIRISFKNERSPRSEAKLYALQRLQERVQRMIEEKQQKLSQDFSLRFGTTGHDRIGWACDPEFHRYISRTRQLHDYRSRRHRCWRIHVEFQHCGAAQRDGTCK